MNFQNCVSKVKVTASDKIMILIIFILVCLVADMGDICCCKQQQIVVDTYKENSYYKKMCIFSSLPRRWYWPGHRGGGRCRDEPHASKAGSGRCRLLREREWECRVLHVLQWVHSSGSCGGAYQLCLNSGDTKLNLNTLWPDDAMCQWSVPLLLL